MRAFIDSGNVFGLYNVHLEDGRVFHDRDAFQVRDLIEKHGLVEVSRRDRAARMIELVQGELGAGVAVEWTAENDEIVLSCVHGGRTHTARVRPLEDDEARGRAWCQEILRAA